MNSVITSEYRILQIPIDVAGVTPSVWSMGSLQDNLDYSWALVFGDSESILYHLSRQGGDANSNSVYMITRINGAA